MNPMAWALPSVGFTPPVTGTGPPNRVPPAKKVTDPVGAFHSLSKRSMPFQKKNELAQNIRASSIESSIRVAC